MPDGGYKAESGRAAWAAGHIPRSGFADLTEDLSDRTAATLYMMPPTEQMAAAMARLGVGENTRVVLYDRAVNMWAARVWWMLRAVGFDQAAVLNGGWKKWTLEGRPTSTAPCAYPPGRFVARPRPELFVGKKVGLVLTGGNIDTRLLANVLLRDLARSGRLARLRITLQDRPGALFKVMEEFDQHQVNIIEIYHQRVFTTLPAKGLITDIECETRDSRHLDRLVAALTNHGYEVSRVELA